MRAIYLLSAAIAVAGGVALVGGLFFGLLLGFGVRPSPGSLISTVDSARVLAVWLTLGGGFTCAVFLLGAVAGEAHANRLKRERP